MAPLARSREELRMAGLAMRITYDKASDAATNYLADHIPTGGAPRSVLCDLEISHGAVILLLSAGSATGRHRGSPGASRILPNQLLAVLCHPSRRPRCLRPLAQRATPIRDSSCSTRSLHATKLAVSRCCAPSAQGEIGPLLHLPVRRHSRSLSWTPTASTGAESSRPSKRLLPAC